MKGFFATTLAAIVAAQTTMEAYDWEGDMEFHEAIHEKYETGLEHVDALTADPYTLAGVYDIHGHEECQHALGHDGHFEYVKLVPIPDAEDYANCSGDYIQSTTKLNGKFMYVNFEKNRFMGWTGEGWSLTSTDYMSDILDGTIASPFGGFHFGVGAGEKPEEF